MTLFGAAKSGSGWDELSGTFRSIAARWSDCTDQPAASRAGGRSSTRHADQVLTEQRLPGEASSTYALRAITGVSACRGTADKPGAGRHRATSD